MLKSDFWHWFAGFWEGEGSIFCNYPKNLQVELCVCQKVRTPLDYIKENIGFGIVICERSGRLWRWRIRNRPEILYVGSKLLPYLRFRRKEMQNALETIGELEKNRKRNVWKSEEIAFLKENCNKLSPREIAQKLCRHTYHSIFTKRKKIGLVGCHQNSWTEEEISFLEKSYGRMRVREIANAIPRHTQKSIRFKLTALKLYKYPANARRYGGKLV